MRTDPVHDSVKDGREVAHVRAGEDRVEHLALFFMPRAGGGEQPRSKDHRYEAEARVSVDDGAIVAIE